MNDSKQVPTLETLVHEGDRFQLRSLNGLLATCESAEDINSTFLAAVRLCRLEAGTHVRVVDRFRIGTDALVQRFVVTPALADLKQEG